MSEFAQNQNISVTTIEQASEILSQNGVVLSNPDLTDEQTRRLSEDVSTEAAALGFTLDVEDEVAVQQAHMLVDDAVGFQDSAVMEHDGYGREQYSQQDAQRMRAKKLLLKSSARDLARRTSVAVEDDVLDGLTLTKIKSATGVDFMKLNKGYPIVMPEERPVTPRWKQEEKSDYVGPVGSTVEVSGVGNARVVSYSQHGKPMIREPRTGKVVSTFGRLR